MEGLRPEAPIDVDDDLPSGTEVKTGPPKARHKQNAKSKKIYVFEDDERCMDCVTGNIPCKVEEEQVLAWNRDIAARKVLSTIPAGITCRNCEASRKTCYFLMWDEGDDDKKTSDWEEAVFKKAYQLGKGLRKLAEEQELAADGQERIANALERIVESFEESAEDKADDEMEE